MSGRDDGPLRALVVDDEPLARTLVRVLLEGDPEIVVAAECSGVDAMAEAARTRPDILFLDVQMPEVDGFSVLSRIGADDAPVVVFVTAYDQYAIRAFDVHALDYLLKPIDEGRFREAVRRAKARARDRRRGANDPGLRALLEDQARRVRRLLVRTRDRTVVVDVDQIDWIEAADYYATLHVGTREHLLRESLNELEQRLDPERFFRVHRSAIVNLERVREIHPLFRGDSELVLRDGTRVRLSRTRRHEFTRRFAPPTDRP